MLFEWCQTATGWLAIYLLHTTFQGGFHILPQEAEKEKKKDLKKKTRVINPRVTVPKEGFFLSTKNHKEPKDSDNEHKIWLLLKKILSHQFQFTPL